ncbi:MAG: chemotaxis-specific protein-glutamate methyltransferase CheB [Actinobacteria bacterium]|nr:chemotaxis-specific protein-glutamate methyltransferase CheB [Actinomycetota bacterium]
MSDLIRVLVADDSATSRTFLVGILSAHPGIVVVGQARDGAEAVALTTRLQPSIVVMDAVMPGMDGFEATQRIMADVPTPVLVVTSALDPSDVALALRSVEVGALAVLPKPTGGTDDGARREAAGFARKVVTLASVRVIRRYPGAGSRGQRRSATDVATAQVVSPRRAVIEIVAVAASTGGPRVVYELLSALPRDLPVPVLVVQHIAEGFVEGFARWLDAGTELVVRLAVEGEPLTPGTVLVAPEDRHLRVDHLRRVVLDDGPPIGGFRPAATALFESIAEAYGDRGAGVMLSGLGDDGLAGLLSLHASGGVVLAQDEATCAVFGMPGVVAAAGIAQTVGPVGALAEQILQHTAKAVT